MRSVSIVDTGANPHVEKFVVLGEDPADSDIALVVGDNAVIRSHSVIYRDVVIGNNLRTGHGVLIREGTRIGDDVLVGTGTVIDGHTSIGSHVSIQSRAYISTNTVIEDYVFIGPCAVLTNDKYPVRKDYELRGPTLSRGASIGANAVILPGVTIGKGAMVAAGACVPRDVPDWKLAIGFPAEVRDLPDDLRMMNAI
ncbi:MAG: DapH/DapD/GlmU-related protein [Euryarchaeota archaeon]|nr:DapH/DapD/GlmU-related protein [Euryarchaeota archaeon]